MMNNEIKSQIDRAKELLTELKNSSDQDLRTKIISDKTRNLTQEVLVKMRSIFDQSMFNFFEKHILPTLSEQEKNKARVYFPIVNKKEDLKPCLGRAMIKNLEAIHPQIYRFLDSIQPYNSDYKWMKEFSTYANEKHIRLTPQKKFEQERIVVTNNQGGQVSWTPQNVKFGAGVKICGAPVDPTTQNIIPTLGIESRKEIWISFSLGESGINSIWLCNKVIENGEQILNKFYALF